MPFWQIPPVSQTLPVQQAPPALPHDPPSPVLPLLLPVSEEASLLPEELPVPEELPAPLLLPVPLLLPAPLLLPVPLLLPAVPLLLPLLVLSSPPSEPPPDELLLDPHATARPRPHANTTRHDVFMTKLLRSPPADSSHVPPSAWPATPSPMANVATAGCGSPEFRSAPRSRSAPRPPG